MKNINRLCIREIEYRLIECGIHRALACLERLDEKHIHFRPNSNSNSINNQILHLDGNVRQWLISTFRKTPDKRRREEEFRFENRKTIEELTDLLNHLEADVRSIFPLILTEDLSETRKVQCYTETLFSIIVHVIEHFSYHLGQITYITKMLLDIDTNYYNGEELGQINKID